MNINVTMRMPDDTFSTITSIEALGIQISDDGKPCMLVDMKKIKDLPLLLTMLSNVSMHEKGQYHAVIFEMKEDFCMEIK